jgi:hypothetical protein
MAASDQIFLVVDAGTRMVKKVKLQQVPRVILNRHSPTLRSVVGRWLRIGRGLVSGEELFQTPSPEQS